MFRHEPAPPDLEDRVFSVLRQEAAATESAARGNQWARAVASSAAAVLIGALAFGFWYEKPVSAAEIVERAVATEVDSLALAGGDVMRRVVAVDEQVPEGGARLFRRVDVWRDPARALTVRRAFDAEGQLVGGEWLQDDGATLVYRPGKPPSAGQRDARALLSLDQLWRLDLSARDFRDGLLASAWSGVTQRDGIYVVTAAKPGEQDPRAHAELLIRADDLRPLQLTVAVADGTGIRTFAIREVLRSRQGVATTPPSAFVPDRALVWTPREPLTSTTARPIPTSIPASVELDVIRRLHRTRADDLEGIDVRLSRGKLIVSGVARSEARLGELRSTVERYEELGILVFQVVAGPERAAALATDRSTLGAAVHRAHLLNRAIARFPLERRRTFDVDAMAAWQSLLRDYARGVRTAVAPVASIVLACESRWEPPSNPDVEVLDASRFEPASLQLRDLVLLIDQRLSVSAVSPCVGDLRDLVVRAVLLAEEFERPWPLTP